MKIASVQYAIGTLRSKEAFWTKVKGYVEEAAKQGARLIVFPEYLTGHLLSLHPTVSNEEACEILHGYTEEYMDQFAALSRDSGLMILAGTHIHRDQAPEGRYYNEAFLFFPDSGRIERHKKVHLTPEERRAWPLAPGERFEAFDTELGRMAIQICYDIEFPEGSRIVADLGAEIILCPSYTDTAAGYYRVRHCSQARAVENQLYVVMSGLVGRMPRVEQVDAGYSRAGIFAPCDRPFPSDGVLAQGVTNRGAVVTAETSLKQLAENRAHGGVSPYYDRKQALYDAFTSSSAAHNK